MTPSARSATLLTGFALSALVLGLAAQGCTVSVCDASKDPNCKVDLGDSGSPGSAGSAGTPGSGTPGGGTDAGTDAPDGVSDPCSVCLYAQCAASHAACETNKDCVGIYNCAIQPGASVRACMDARPNGQGAYTGLYQCDQRHACSTCAAECAGNPIKTSCDTWVTQVPAGSDAGNDAGVALTEAGAAGQSCDQCVASKCTSQKGACGAGSECELYSQCVQACIDKAPSQLDACFEGCGTAFPGGKTAGEGLSKCTNDNCRTECFGN